MILQPSARIRIPVAIWAGLEMESGSDRSPVEEKSNPRDHHHPQHQLGKLQMLPALPRIVLVVESIGDFQARHGGDGGDSSSSPRCSSTSTSSIGASDLGENVDESNEVESPLRDSSSSGPLERMETLESSLPLKRGLSQFFDGKSRSFTSLKEVASAASATQLRKPEYPFKRRKMVMHSQMRSRAKSSSNLRKMLGRAGGEAWSPPRFVSVSSFLPRSFSLSNIVHQNV
ncbi:uncharacterized protein LOC9640634 [Selaginella moellendorffii]|nr:uncharacterized protein LOC9640634 [Selaginella moellendorffii]|eukprot:XP_002971990.2 uncharacterized protein LOC9640634 [Selaginella moellendorffii]